MRAWGAVLGMVLMAATAAEARTKLVALPDREAVTVRLDNPSATLVEEERVLTLQEGENLVDFSWQGVQIAPESIRLTILSHPDRVTLLSVSFPPNETALTWRMSSKGAFEEKVRIAYLISGLDRLVTYRALASRDEKTLDLDAYLVLRNWSGEDFTNARVALGQGSPFTGAAANEETRQIHFLSLKKVPVTKTFTWDSGRQPWEPKREKQTPGLPVHYVIGDREGLGQPWLWEGKARVFQDDGRGTPLFLGEDSVAAVPRGEKMRIYLGDSRDVAVTQVKEVDRRVNQRPNTYRPVLYDTDEQVITTLENFKDQPVTVDVVERVSGEWEMEKATMEWERKDANTVVFHVPLAAKGKAEVTFLYHRRNQR